MNCGMIINPTLKYLQVWGELWKKRLQAIAWLDHSYFAKNIASGWL